MSKRKRELWAWIVGLGLYGVVLQVSGSSVATGKVGGGADPQFIHVEAESKEKAAQLPVSFSSPARSLRPCPGTVAVFSFDCRTDKEKK